MPKRQTTVCRYLPKHLAFSERRKPPAAQEIRSPHTIVRSVTV